MKNKNYLELNSKEKIEYKEKAQDIAREELQPLVDEGIVRDIHSPNPNKPPIRPALKTAHNAMKKKLASKGISYNFAGDISKIDELMQRKRKNLDKPLSVMIKGCEVFLTLSPFIYLGNSENEEVNKRLDELIEKEKFKATA